MGEIWDKVTLKGYNKEKDVDALFDTGATFCHINEDLAKEVGVIMLKPIIDSKSVDNRTLDATLGVGFVTVKGCQIPVFFSVKKTGVVPLTIGHTAMQALNAKIDLEHDNYEIKCPIISK